MFPVESQDAVGIGGLYPESPHSSATDKTGRTTPWISTSIDLPFTKQGGLIDLLSGIDWFHPPAKVAPPLLFS
jgi:hypothetical protein